MRPEDLSTFLVLHSTLGLAPPGGQPGNTSWEAASWVTPAIWLRPDPVSPRPYIHPFFSLRKHDALNPTGRVSQGKGAEGFGARPASLSIPAPPVTYQGPDPQPP